MTTALGLRDGGAAEVGPLAGTAVSQAGIGGLVALKLVFFAVCLAAWYRLRTPGRVAIPLAIAAVGLAVTAWNLAVLLL